MTAGIPKGRNAKMAAIELARAKPQTFLCTAYIPPTKANEISNSPDQAESPSNNTQNPCDCRFICLFHFLLPNHYLLHYGEKPSVVIMSRHSPVFFFSLMPNRKRSTLIRLTSRSYIAIMATNESPTTIINFGAVPILHWMTKKPIIIITVWCRI